MDSSRLTGKPRRAWWLVATSCRMLISRHCSDSTGSAACTRTTPISGSFHSWRCGTRSREDAPRLTPFSSASSSGPSGTSASQSRRARAHESAPGTPRSAPSNPSARDALGTSDTRRVTASAGPPAGVRPGCGADAYADRWLATIEGDGRKPPAPSRQRHEAWLPHWGSVFSGRATQILQGQLSRSTEAFHFGGSCHTPSASILSYSACVPTNRM